MAEFIPATHDVVFKALFVYNPDVLRAFLRDILDLPITDETVVTILNPELVPDAADGKMCRLDIHVEMGKYKFNVEMQARVKGFSKERVLYYWADMFVDKFEAGGKYEDLEKTYSVNVLGFKLFDCKEYHSSFSIREDSRNEQFIDKLSIHVFELPKVPNTLIADDDKQMWMELIKADSEEALEMVRTSTQNPMIQRAVDAVRAINADEALREQIRQRDKAIRDYENDMAVVRAEGKAEGLAEGQVEGEQIKAVKMAIKLIKRGKGS